MRRVDYLILHNDTPSICKWKSDGVHLISKLRDINLNEMFEIEPVETLDFIDDLIDDLIDECNNRKYYLQLREIKKYFNEKYGI